MARYRIVPERSRAWIDARTNLHPVHAEATGLQGFVEAGLAGGAIDVSGTVQAEVSLEIERITSGNPLFESELRRRVEARRYPVVSGKVSGVSEAGPGRYRVKGEIEFHGVTQPADGEVRVDLTQDGTITIEGERTFDIRDYGIEPPRLLLLKAEPEVQVRVQIVAQPEG